MLSFCNGAMKICVAYETIGGHWLPEAELHNDEVQVGGNDELCDTAWEALTSLFGFDEYGELDTGKLVQCPFGVFVGEPVLKVERAGSNRRACRAADAVWRALAGVGRHARDET